MQRLYFVRHGQSQANVDRVFAGQADTPLTAQGREEAQHAIDEVRSLGIDHIISSPLSRTYDTAKIIAEGIGYPTDRIELYDVLMERSFGSAVGLSWDNDISDVADVETMKSVAARARQAFDYIVTLPYETILVVGHGTFWQEFYMTAHPDQKVGDADEPKNAEISRIV
ncbi:MAG: histidine phosphatase family protein [Candidatus Saccharimonadales bacterium]